MASSEHFRKIQMASTEHHEYFVNFPLARIFLLIIENVVLRQEIAIYRAETSKLEQQVQI